MSLKTEDLITLLSKSPQTARTAPTWLYPVLGLCLASIFIYCLTLITPIGYRQQYPAQIAANPIVLLKHLISAIIAATAISLALKGRFPEVTLKRTSKPALLWLAVGVIAIFGFGTTLLARSLWLNAIVGQSLISCVVTNSVIASIIAVSWLVLLRRDAVTQPAWTGYWVGLGSGGIATFSYAFVCIEDQPMFFSLWYPVSMLVAASIAAVIAPRILRW